MQMADVVRRADDVEPVELDGSTILMHSCSELVFVLEGVSASLWQHLARGPASLRELVDCVCIQFDAAPEVVVEDVVAFVKQMVADGLALVNEGRQDTP